MSIELIPFTELETAVLGEQLHEQVRRNMQPLRRRYYLGTVARYGVNADKAKASVERAKRHAASPGGAERALPFAAVDSDLRPDKTGLFIFGVGTIWRGLEMGVMKRPLPPIAAGILPGERTAMAPVTNVTGWLDLAHDRNLRDVYEGLLKEVRPGEVATTIEPLRVPEAIHSAIINAGMVRLGDAERYDVGENPRRIPPRSYLYANAAELA